MANSPQLERSAEGVEGGEHGGEAAADFFEAGNGTGFLFGALGIDAHLAFGGIDVEAAVLDEVFYHLQALHVGLGVEARAFGVALGAQVGKLALPEAQGGLRDIKQYRGLAYLVVFLLRTFHSCSQTLAKIQKNG